MGFSIMSKNILYLLIIFALAFGGGSFLLGFRHKVSKPPLSILEPDSNKAAKLPENLQRLKKQLFDNLMPILISSDPAALYWGEYSKFVVDLLGYKKCSLAEVRLLLESFTDVEFKIIIQHVRWIYRFNLE